MSHRGVTWRRHRPGTLLRVGALGIELDPDEPQLDGGRLRRGREVRRDPRLPADRLADGLQGGAGVERVETHLAVVVEVVDAQVGDHDAGTATEPALLAPDPGGVLGPAQVARAGPEVDRLDERPLRLAHDHEDLPGVDGDLAGAARAGQAGLRVVVVADDRGVDVAEPVDLGGAQEADVDEPALEVEAEQLVHAGHRRRAGDDRRIADAEREAGRPGAEDAGLVDQLELGRHRPLGQVDRDVGQPDPDEADVLAGQLAGRRDDHHLGLREGLVGRCAHRYSP